MDPVEINEILERNSELKDFGFTYLGSKKFSFLEKIGGFFETMENSIKGYLVQIERKVKGIEINYKI